MNTTPHVIRSGRRVRSLVIAAAMLALCLPSATASAEELFDFDPGRWMSSQRYTDNLKKNSPKAEEPEVPVALPELTEEAAEFEKAELPKPQPPKADAERLLKPYSYSPPPMPGVNSGFTMRVTSTDDPDTAEKPAAPRMIPRSEEEKPKDLVLPDNWKAPTSLAISDPDDDDGDEKSLNVRMSVLPTPSAVPAPVGKPGKADTKRVRVQPKTPEKTKEQIAQEKAACDALENFKKQQIDAIQSDRQTLKALQDAVNSLGLAKKMDFRPENGSVLLDAEDDSGPWVPRGTPVPKGR